MKKIVRFLYYWLPPLVIMIIIFVLSSRQKIAVTHEYLSDFIIFKTLHMIEYAILYFFLFRAFYKEDFRNMSIKKKFFYPFIIAVIYAASDEIHQTFIDTRQGRLRDVIIDTTGITIMYIYIKTQLDWLKKII
jgi:VanZ family protein